MIFVDGIPSADPSMVAGLVSVNQVDRIEVITGANALMGGNGTHGAIFIYTTRSTIHESLGGIEGKQNQSFESTGFIVPRQFDESVTRLPYEVWIPSINSDEEGVIHLKIRLDEEVSEYRFVVYGTSETGDLIRNILYLKLNE